MKTKIFTRCIVPPLLAAVTLLAASPLLAQEPRRPIPAVAGTAQEPSALPATAPPSPPQCPTREILAPHASPSSTLTHVLTGVTFADFGSQVPNRGVAHTFHLPPCGCIVGAKLEFRATALPDNPSNDGIDLGFSSLQGFPRWAAWLGTGPSTSPSLSSPAWGSPPLQRTFTLDLAALPTTTQGVTTSLLSALQLKRELDFYVEDDTEVDSVKLTYTICDCPPCGKAEICISKFYDKNRNRTKDTNEPWLAGWAFKATDQAGNVILFPPTNSGGKTCVSVPAPATYTISEVTQPGWSQSTPVNPQNPVVSVTPGGQVVNLLFGNWHKPGPGTKDPK